MSPPVNQELTPRQQKILELLQEGKVNKEVARELDIGVGTVKQHIVAIFKKLKVTNRTAAAFRSVELNQAAERGALAPSQTGLLSGRPCVVLGIALCNVSDPAIIRTFYGALASLASAHEAIFLTRHGNAGEVIFGVQRVTEFDVALALKTANKVYLTLQDAFPDAKLQLRGCLTAGIAFASMGRFGGWSGEAIASAAVALARDLTQAAPDGRLTTDQEVLNLCKAFGVAGISELSKGISFDAIKNLLWTGQRPSYPFAGRTAEFGLLVQALEQAFVHRGSLALLEGEMGMGKTRICQELLANCISRGGWALYFQSLPAILESDLSDLERQSARFVEDALLALRSADLSTGRLIVLDDFHLIPKERHAELFQAAGDAVDFGRMVLFCGRSGFSALAPPHTVRIRLRPMPANDMQLLIWQVLDLPDDKKRVALQKIILDTATGVPLFAVEMARHPTSARPSLSLMVAVHARLDGLHLDSLLLRSVAKHPRPITAAEVKAALAQDGDAVDQQLDRAVSCGVLVRESDGTFSFSHPMIRRVIANSDMK